MRTAQSQETSGRVALRSSARSHKGSIAIPVLALALALFSSPAPAQNALNPAQPAPNSNPTYQALRNIALGTEAVSVNDLTVRRDAATLHFRSGTICFTPAIEGKVTGAVFSGDGSLVLDPPPSERSMLKLLTKEDEFNETFAQLALRFTDSTYDEIKKAGTPASGGCEAGPLKESQHVTRSILKMNLEARILADVFRPEPGGLFYAFVHGKRYNDKEVLSIDPLRAGDQLQFFTYDENKFGLWSSFPFADSNRQSDLGAPMRIQHQQLDTTIEGSGALSGKATTTFANRVNGTRVVEFDLFPTLRVQSVTADGKPVEFIQEGANADADFAVILPKALAADESFTVTTTYAGKEAIRNEGNGNYYPISRSNWFPNDPQADLGEFVPYDMTFRIPKGMRMAATGALVSDATEGNLGISVWKSEAPQTVAGFNFGKFKLEEAKLTNPDYDLQSFANQDPPNWVQDIKDENPNAPLGTMSTTVLNKKALAEGQVAVKLYTDYFGPPLFKHLQLTQQTACNYGQSWPGLVWIPICYYFDGTVRHQLGIDSGDGGYWSVVTPHEVAHQWWGHTVGFASYRDQWMSEGFSDFSASLFLTLLDNNLQKYTEFWNDECKLLVERNPEGFRAIDAGPVTLGYRLSNSRTGFDLTRRLIYPKGAYILHMIRLMMYDKNTGDQHFKELMQDFVKTYSGKAATTEDFKAMVEKHMTLGMDAGGDRTMNWFFNEYVYGTQLPAYKMTSSFDTGADGDVVLKMNLAQSGVNDNFRMVVPLYLELADGKVVFLARAHMVGNTSIDQTIPLKGLKTRPRRAMVNYYDDVLASPGQ